MSAKVQILIKELHLLPDKLLTLIKEWHLAHQIVTRILHELLIFLKFLQVGTRNIINSQGQRKVDQANKILQPKEDQKKEQDQLKLLMAIMELVNFQDIRSMEKIILSLIIQKIQLLLTLIKALKNHHQLLHLLAMDQIKNHQLLDQEKMFINLEGDLKKAMGEKKQVHQQTSETKKAQEEKIVNLQILEK
jgi:hypothetical protein